MSTKINLMKTIVLFLIVTWLGLSQQQNVRLKGTYKVEFDKGQQGFQITFNDSTYTKRMPDAITYKGKLVYSKFKVKIGKDRSENPIEIDNREIGKDTIKFVTKSKADLSSIISRGRMIKIK